MRVKEYRLNGNNVEIQLLDDHKVAVKNSNGVVIGPESPAGCFEVEVLAIGEKYPEVYQLVADHISEAASNWNYKCVYQFLHTMAEIEKAEKYVKDSKAAKVA